MLVTSSMFQFVSAMELVVKGFLEKKEKPINVKNEMLKLIEGNTHVDINGIPYQYIVIRFESFLVIMHNIL